MLTLKNECFYFLWTFSVAVSIWPLRQGLRRSWLLKIIFKNLTTALKILLKLEFSLYQLNKSWLFPISPLCILNSIIYKQYRAKIKILLLWKPSYWSDMWRKSIQLDHYPGTLFSFSVGFVSWPFWYLCRDSTSVNLLNIVLGIQKLFRIHLCDNRNLSLSKNSNPSVFLQILHLLFQIYYPLTSQKQACSFRFFYTCFIQKLNLFSQFTSFPFMLTQF